MEFKEIKRVIYNLEYQETREALTTEALEYLKELKIILKQREEMLEMLQNICKWIDKDINVNEFKSEYEQLIKEATKL